MPRPLGGDAIDLVTALADSSAGTGVGHPLIDESVWGDLGDLPRRLASPAGGGRFAQASAGPGTVEVCEPAGSPFSDDGDQGDRDLDPCGHDLLDGVQPLEPGLARDLADGALRDDDSADGRVQPSRVRTGLDIATDFVPGVSNIKDGLTALTGRNPVTGEEAGAGGRVLAGIFALPGLGNALKHLRRPLQAVGRHLSRAGRWAGDKVGGLWRRAQRPHALEGPPARAAGKHPALPEPALEQVGGGGTHDRKPGSHGEFKSTQALRQGNRQARDAARAAGLSRDEAAQLHREITGKGYTRDEVFEIARDIKRGNY